MSAVTAMPANACPAHGWYFGYSCPNCGTVTARPLIVPADAATNAAPPPENDADGALRPGRYDAASRRQAVRKGRERGCSIYIAAEELVAAGVPLDGPPPFYRVWGRGRRSVLVRLYLEG